MIRLSDNTRYSLKENKITINKLLLNYFSAPIKELRDVEGGSILVYPQSFTETVDEVGEQTVFDITIRDSEGNPIEFWTRNLVGFISNKGQTISFTTCYHEWLVSIC